MSETRFLPHSMMQRLYDVLLEADYEIHAPRVRDGAIVFSETTAADELPWGVSDVQSPGAYRLEASDVPSRAFAWANGPQALKPLLFAPTESLWRVSRDDDGAMRFQAVVPEAPRRAVIGVRACDLAALALQDAHFLGKEDDGYYRARRDGLFLVAINCTHPAATCFCASTGDGPAVRQGFDLLLDELDDGFVMVAGSDAGREILLKMVPAAVSHEQHEAALQQQCHAAEVQQRTLPAGNLQPLLFSRLSHPRWQAVGERCLACGNCTAVCPTCFCHSEQEHPALDGGGSEHRREWDSCFTAGHSYIHGVVIRAETAERYRQWLTHKLGSWHEQYGRSGCVGCGRCITWCPVGIDITEEAEAICGGEA